MTARRRVTTAMVPAGVLVAGLALAGCGGSDGTSEPDVTLPSSLSIPATTSSTAGASTTTTVEVPPTNPTGTDAPVIVSLKAEPGAASCTAGTIPALISFEVEPEPPVRVFTVFLDGSTTAAAASNSGTTLTIPAVPCDGAIHQVLFIATGTNTKSSTQAVAFRAPG